MTGFAKEFLWPLLLLIVGPSAAMVGSRIKTGDWWAWPKLIPAWVYVVLVGGFILWLLAAIIRRRNVQIRCAAKRRVSRALGIPRGNSVGLGEETYAGVVWRVMLRDTGTHIIQPDDVEVGVPPRCPRCQTELGEWYDWLQFAVWECPQCRWRKRGALSYYHLEPAVLKVARRKLERKLESGSTR